MAAYPMAVGIRKDDAALKAWVDAWVEANLKNGKLNAIYKKYFHQDLPEKSRIITPGRIALLSRPGGAIPPGHIPHVVLPNTAEFPNDRRQPQALQGPVSRCAHAIHGERQS